MTPIDSLREVLDRLEATPDAVAVVLDHGGPVGVLTHDAVRAYLDDVARRNVWRSAAPEETNVPRHTGLV